MENHNYFAQLLKSTTAHCFFLPKFLQALGKKKGFFSAKDVNHLFGFQKGLWGPWSSFSSVSCPKPTAVSPVQHRDESLVAGGCVTHPCRNDNARCTVIVKPQPW